MDWSLVLTGVSHLVTLTLGVVLGRWTVVRHLRVSEHDGHISLEVRHPNEK